MSKDEKIKHLENLKSRIDRMTSNKMSIDELSNLINLELTNEQNEEIPSVGYIRNLKITINKQLKALINSRKNPRNRIDEFNECRSHFKQDINKYQGDLRNN